MLSSASGFVRLHGLVLIAVVGGVFLGASSAAWSQHSEAPDTAILLDSARVSSRGCLVSGEPPGPRIAALQASPAGTSPGTPVDCPFPAEARC